MGGLSTTSPVGGFQDRESRDVGGLGERVADPTCGDDQPNPPDHPAFVIVDSIPTTRRRLRYFSRESGEFFEAEESVTGLTLLSGAELLIVLKVRMQWTKQ